MVSAETIKETKRIKDAARKMLRALLILNGDVDKAPVRFTKSEKKKIMQDAINKALGK